MRCESCQKECSSYTALHTHLTKEHKISQGDYYQFFFPRYDLFDGEKIIFKDRESYFKSDFNFKSNLFEWLKANPQAKEYALKILTDRAAEKETTRYPSHVELKSLFSPSLMGFEKIFGGFGEFQQAAKVAGLTGLGYEKPLLKEGDMKISQDTREQYPLKFDLPVTVQKLACGDYCPDGDFFCDLFIERKSLADLAGTLTQGLERFEREIERAANLGFYLVVLVECRFSDLEDYSPNNSFSRKISGAYLLNKIRKLMNNNIQFLFSSSRARSAELTEKIFRMGEQAKRVDLEFLKDKGEL